MQHRVSIIMPAYNAGRYVEEAIRSVVGQSYADWELIVVDDGSTDETANIVRAYTATDNRVRYLHQENGRQGKARNTGVANSTGPLVAFLDADDLWLSEKLELQVHALQEMEADLVYSAGFVFVEGDAGDATKTMPVLNGRIEGREMFDLLLLQNSIPVLSVVMRRQTLLGAGLFEESLPYQGCEDYDLWLKVARQGAVFYGMQDRLVRYRRHATASTRNDSNWLKPMLRVVNRHINDGGLSEVEKKVRIKGLYRDLIAALLNENNRAEASQYMSQLAGWDQAGTITSFQKMLMTISPGSFNFVSRNCFYRAEWHMRALRKKLKELRSHGDRGESQVQNSRGQRRSPA